MKQENIFICDTNDEAVKKAEDIMQKGDYVLIKASWGMKFREIVQRLS